MAKEEEAMDKQASVVEAVNLDAMTVSLVSMMREADSLNAERVTLDFNRSSGDITWRTGVAVVVFGNWASADVFRHRIGENAWAPERDVTRGGSLVWRVHVNDVVTD